MFRNKTVMINRQSENQIEPMQADNQLAKDRLGTAQTMRSIEPTEMEKQEPGLSKLKKVTFKDNPVKRFDSKVNNYMMTAQKKKFSKYFTGHVDFHHNIAFKFERAYRMRKKIILQADQSGSDSSMEE